MRMALCGGQFFFSFGYSLFWLEIGPCLTRTVFLRARIFRALQSPDIRARPWSIWHFSWLFKVPVGFRARRFGPRALIVLPMFNLWILSSTRAGVAVAAELLAVLLLLIPCAGQQESPVPKPCDFDCVHGRCDVATRRVFREPWLLMSKVIFDLKWCTMGFECLESESKI